MSGILRSRRGGSMERGVEESIVNIGTIGRLPVLRGEDVLLRLMLKFLQIG